MATIQMKKNELVYEEMFPFRKCGDMVQPNSEYCKECKGACCNAGISLYPRDFEKGKEVASLIRLLKMELVTLCIVEAFDDGCDDGCYIGDFIDVHISGDDHGSCIFKCVWGCIIPADMRPLPCKFYGPAVDYGYKDCRYLQRPNSYDGGTDWKPYKEEFLKMGILECPNVTIN